MQNLSTIAFAGALGVLVLVVINKISAKHAMLLGGGLVVVGFLTQPAQTT